MRLIAQVPGVPNGIEDIVDTTDVTPWDVVWALATLMIGIILSRVARAAARRYGSRANLPPNIIDLLGTVSMWAIVSVASVIALTFVGLDVAPVWLLLLFLMIAFVIGGRSLLESFGAGVLLQARAPFEPGDLIRLGDDLGVVHQVDSRVVVIDSVDGRRIYVPNTQVLSNPIQNLTHLEIRMSWLYLNVEYGTDLEHAIAIAESAAKGLEEIIERPRPRAQVMSFEDSAVRIGLRYWHRSSLPQEWIATDAMARAVYAAFRDEGIVFAFPQSTLWWGSEQAPGPNPGTDTGPAADVPE